MHLKRKALKNQIKTKARKERKKLPTSERQTPVTIEDKQIGGDEYGQEYE